MKKNKFIGIEAMKCGIPLGNSALGCQALRSPKKVVLMIRNNNVPSYDMRMALQKKSLEKAGYDLYQVFIRYKKKGLNLWCLHNDKVIHNVADNLTNTTIRCTSASKSLVPLRNMISMNTLSKFIDKHVPKPDVIHTHNLDMMPIAIKLKKKYNCKLVYDMREYWDKMAGRGLSSVVSGYYGKKDKRQWKHADSILVMEQPMYNFYRPLVPDSIPITIVMNTKPLTYDKWEPSASANLTELKLPFLLLYLGTIGDQRFLKETIEVVETLKGKVRFLIGGCKQSSEYYNTIVKMCSEYKHSYFLGELPQTQVIPMTHICDCVLNMINPHDFNSSRATCNKQFEAMVAGRPIISTKFTTSGKITDDYNCGIVTLYSKKHLKYALEQLVKSPKDCAKYGRYALRAAKSTYNWKVDSARMLKAYKKVVE